MRTKLHVVLVWALAWLCGLAMGAAAGEMPFRHKVEIHRNKEGDCVFTLRLEQPFLAEEFEKSNYLRLRSADTRAYLIYPTETKFRQKHAEFYGRLRGKGKVTLTLAYETVSENLDGSRRVAVRQGSIDVDIPAEPAGPKSIYLDWAREQNRYFARMLRYYPHETFFQYCLLQSKARYGVSPPPTPKLRPDGTELETSVYHLLTSSQAVQQSLQYQQLSTRGSAGDLTTHISALSPPSLRSLPYEKLLDEKRTRDKAEPQVHEIARLVPEDQYFLHFNSMRSLGELHDLGSQWGDGLLELFTLRAKDNRLRDKLEDQLCLRRDALTKLFGDRVVSEMAATGADPFWLEGTDVTVILAVKQPAVFERAAAAWLADVRKRHPDVAVRQFNYRGHKIAARYTKDRVVSSFVTQHKGYVVYSNSHRAIRRVLDAAAGAEPSLHAALDYRYVSTILPPSKAPNAGYLFASEAFIRQMIAPAAKISEKRRLQCYNNLVMLNNASLFFRMEYGRSPGSLSELIERRFVDPERVVCPHGGAYAFDADRDMCTCSLHNRLKYLTPNVELAVLKVSRQEAAEYERYKTRYQAFWGKVFGPIAIRITMAPRVKLETCVLPFANGSFYRELRGMVDKKPQAIGTARIAPSAFASLVTVAGRKAIGGWLGGVPGVDAVLKAHPTLTDLSWLGDRLSLHFCDAETIFEIDPTRLRPIDFPLVGKVSLDQQALVTSLIMAATMPVYVTLDVENREKATRLLEHLSRQIFLEGGELGNLKTSLDAYRLPDYKAHALYVFSGRIYAVKIRLHVALVGSQLVAATKPEILREVIDASTAKETRPPAQAHMLLRLNRRALKRLYDDIRLYWAEKSRVACHRNIVAIHNLYKLYGTPIAQISRLSEAKYGVRYYCPDGGVYAFDPKHNQVVCSVHGNRERSRQERRGEGKSSFARFFESIDEVVASLRFRDDALIATIEIVRSKGGGK